jgi:hypothetical protein
MLRDFGAAKSTEMEKIKHVLLEFDLPEATRYNDYGLVRYEVISPDSFMWRITNGSHVYYLYAQDYISGLNQVKHMFSSYLKSTKWELIPVKEPRQFTESAPVLGAVTYQQPEDAMEMMKYAADSGVDFVFLARSAEKSENALFSDESPRGFQGHHLTQ